MPATNETAFQPIGPAYLYLGDFTGTPDVKELGLVRNVQFNPGIQTAWTANDAQGGLPSADGIKVLAARPVVTAEMQSMTYAEIVKLILNATTTSSGTDAAVGVPDKFASVAAANVPTLFVLPSSESADGVNAQHGIWIPAVSISVENINFGRVEPGEITQAYSVTFTGAYREVDQNSTSIPENYRSWFMGKPSLLGLAWTK
jgi:hypothetical protein